MTRYVPPMYWHHAGDSNVKLWVPFDGDLSTDISIYQNGAGTNTGATISGGQLTILTGSTIQQIVWGPNAVLARVNGEPWTLECFLTWTSSSAHGFPGGDLLYTLTGISGTHYFNFHVYDSAGKVALETPEFGLEGASATNVLAGAGKVHLAMVHPEGTGAQTVRCYVGGAQVFTYTTPAGRLGSSGEISIGKTVATGTAIVEMDDVRFSTLERYTGTSFTPPTSPL